ncbi:helix-turn-helix domain-containing protein [Henriciella litoralis]|uniref:helix-turn-helix domain-containing protein n=1 Tax=Henriciella litoralis TaxID=568102 RepID=UPI001469D3FC|nr:helix-turn-helix domain-containing protein [Henriciella litoralis]
MGALALIAVLTIRDNRAWRSAPYLLLACLSVAALFVGYTLEEFRAPLWLHVAARLLDVPHLVLVWLFALSLYQREFQLRAAHVIVGLAYTAPIFWIRFAEFGLVPLVPAWLISFVSVTSILLIGHLIFATLREWPDDLVAERRRSRLFFVLTIIFVVVVAAVSEPFLVGRDGIAAETFKVVSIWPAIAIAAVWLLKADTNGVRFDEAGLSPSNISASDAALKEKLDRVMIEQSAFKRRGLSIVSLASELCVTQHRLRALINGTLGFQNFSTYVNALRIAEMKFWLSDEGKRHLPIQTLALDCGFKSLAPFNRAFRESEGVTPSEYRARQLGPQPS